MRGFRLGVRVRRCWTPHLKFRCVEVEARSERLQRFEERQDEAEGGVFRDDEAIVQVKRNQREVLSEGGRAL